MECTKFNWFYQQLKKNNFSQKNNTSVSVSSPHKFGIYIFFPIEFDFSFHLMYFNVIEFASNNYPVFQSNVSQMSWKSVGIPQLRHTTVRAKDVTSMERSYKLMYSIDYRVLNEKYILFLIVLS